MFITIYWWNFKLSYFIDRSRPLSTFPEFRKSKLLLQSQASTKRSLRILRGKYFFYWFYSGDSANLTFGDFQDQHS